MRNPPSWLTIFRIVPFSQIRLFPKELITFIISFISSFVQVIPEPVIDERLFLIFITNSIKPCICSKFLKSSFEIMRFFLVSVLKNQLANESCIIPGKTVSSLDCIILDN